jgi:GPH family glycoside/pentoside/hexuronide:cation symporter
MNNKLPMQRKIMYGSGELGFSLTSTIIAAYFLFFLTSVVGIPMGVASIALLIGKNWDWINDPLFGYISDHTHTRWGRRRPFLLFGPVPYAIIFALMWWRPPLQGQVALVLYYAAVYVFYEAAATMVYMPYFALTPELTSDYDERTSLVSLRAFFSIFGSLLAFSLPEMVVNGFIPEHAGNVFLMGAIFALISALPLYVVFFGTKERQEFIQQEQPGLLQSIKESVQNRPFVFGTIIYLFTWVTVDLLQTILIFYITFVVMREADTTVIMATIFIVAILAIPLWTWTSRHMNKRIAYIIGMVFLTAVLMVLMNLTPLTPLYLILGLCVLAGIGVAAAHVIPWAIIPDAIEVGELKTGRRHEGMYYSLISLAQKIASGIAIPGAGLVMQVTGFIPNAAQQPASALLGIRLLTGPIPGVMMLIGIVFALVYPLGREGYTQIAQELEERRAALSRGG